MIKKYHPHASQFDEHEPRLETNLAAKVRHSNIGVVVHTEYFGDKISELAAGPYRHTKFSKLSNHPKVNLINSTYGVYKRNTEHLDRSMLKHLLTISKIQSDIIDSNLDVDQWLYHDEKALRAYVNRTFREGFYLNYSDFIDFLVEYYKGKQRNVVKTETKRKYEDELNRLLEIFGYKKRGVQALFDIVNELHTMKSMIYSALGNQINDFQQHINGKECTGEGYVVANARFMAKIVNRVEFTKVNKEAHDK
jgi:hypothetical protein